jgi:uncharacterized protein YceH (UPF0502 family)
MFAQKRYNFLRTNSLSLARAEAEDLSEKSPEKDLADLRERVVRLEVQVAEIAKRVEAINNYTRQLYEYLNKLGR